MLVAGSWSRDPELEEAAGRTRDVDGNGLQNVRGKAGIGVDCTGPDFGPVVRGNYRRGDYAVSDVGSVPQTGEAVSEDVGGEETVGEAAGNDGERVEAEGVFHQIRDAVAGRVGGFAGVGR